MPLYGSGLRILRMFGSHLAHELLVAAAHRDAGGLGHLERHAVGRLDRHRVREADLELELARPLGVAR